MPRLADRRIDPHHVAEPLHVLGVEQQILRAGLDRDVDAARLGLAHDVERVLRTFVRDMQARAGPFGEIDRPADRLDLADRRPRGEMGQRVGASGLLHLRLPARHDRRVLGMDDDALADPRDDLEGLEHGAVAGCRQIAERVAHEAFEADHTCFVERLQLVEVVLVKLQALHEAGVVGFKCFMGNTFGDLPAPSDGAMLEAFEIIARLGKRIVVHAENPSIMARRQAQMEEAGRSDPLAHLAARPAICEIEAVSRAIHFAEWTGARLHIAHKSSKDALDIVRQAKARGVDVTVETCPQYLLLDSRDMQRLGNVMRVNPPIREPGHAEPLWQALRDGVVDMLATDHAPHTIPEKTDPNVWQCCCGFPGVETAVPLMLTEVAAGHLTLTHYVRVTAMNPAKAWGLFPRKGALQVGSDADITIVDLAREARVRADALHSKSKITPFDGRPVRGVPVATLVRGKLVARDGTLVGTPGWGRAVEPSMPAPAPRNADWTSAA